MIHAELVEVAVAWLLRGVPYESTWTDANGAAQSHKWKRRHQPVFAEIVTAANETPDAIGFASGYSTVVECKVSRADFFAEKRKARWHHATAGMGRSLWYLTPTGLVRPEEVPEWAGLAYARGRTVDVAKQAPMREIDVAAQRNECLVLSSAVRRHSLGVQFNEKRGRFATVASQEETR